MRPLPFPPGILDELMTKYLVNENIITYKILISIDLLEINISIKTNVINVQVHLQKTTIPSLNVRAKHANSRHKSLYVKLKLERHYMANLKLLEPITKLYTYNFNQCPTSRQTTSMAETLFIKHMGLHGSSTTVAFSLTNPRYGISSLLGIQKVQPAV